MHSQYGINSYSKIKLKIITGLLLDAHKKDLEEKLWQQWLVEFGKMDSTNFISFEKYKANAFKVVENVEVEKADKEKILADAEAIKKIDEQRFVKKDT